MHWNCKNLMGQRFGRLVALKPTERRNQRTIVWKCRCSCGNMCEVGSSSLRSGLTQSCGCLRRELSKKRLITHGMRKHPLYNRWRNMKSRCEKTGHPFYKYYGGRGITICPEWQCGPVDFIKWALANGYEKSLTVERKNNDGPYAPWNCRFATRKEQRANTRPISYGPHKQRWFFAFNLKTGEWDESNNQAEFARRHKISPSPISFCLMGKYKQHKSWIFQEILGV